MNTTELIPIGGAAIEITVGLPHPTLAAAHPADALAPDAVALLGETAGTGVVCINPRGVGNSAARRPGWQGTLEQMVDDVEAVRTRLGVAAWVFWGMSGGGWLGQLYAHRHPRALRGVILESACACYRERLADPACLLSPFHPSWRRELERRGLVAADSHREVGDPDATAWIEVDGVGSVFRRTDGPALLVAPFPVSALMRETMPALWAVDTRGLLPALRVPALVICGSADPVMPLPHGRAVQQAIPGAELIVVEGGGHVPTGQRRPEVRDAVRRFLVSLSGPGGAG
jgi:pimeloyl-ACP methyl ester carboxylesterase